MTIPLEIWHPFTQPALDRAPIHVTRAEGVYLYTAGGGKLIDAISSWWVNLHGHCHPHIASAIATQVRQLDHVLLAGVTHGAIEELTRRLRSFLPQELTHIFFSDDGSTAVEVALKIAVQYWRNIGQPKKTGIVALEHGYHGDTVGAMSVSADSGFTDAFAAMRFPVHRVHTAYCYRCPVGKQRETCQIDCLEAMQRLLSGKHEELAAVIVEPLLQGAGGMIIHPREFLARIRELCSQYGVLLIADEVLTGFGRCGAMFACELAEVTPDIMCLSKGITGGFLPMGATICADYVQKEFVSPDRRRTFYHGHSYTGNPIACAAAIANLEVFRSEPVAERIAAISALHGKRLAGLKTHSAVAETRSIGTVAAVELRAEDPGYGSNLRAILYDFFLSKGILLRPLGHVVYILPPYVITAAELNSVYDVVGEALEIVAKNLPLTTLAR
jgi:adenosylmethionine---8-amino-7-oxononanoate aminotransferase